MLDSDNDFDSSEVFQHHYNEKNNDNENIINNNDNNKYDNNESYTDKLILHLCKNLDTDNISLADVIISIKKFSTKQGKTYKKRKYDLIDNKIPFGKHKGKKLDAIDIQYLKWLLTADCTSDNLKKDIKKVIKKKKMK